MDESLRGKIPPKRKAKDELVRTHVSHLKTQNANQNAPRAVKQPVLSEAYPASIRSIRDLEIIPLSELRIETHHRRQGIIVRTITAPYHGAAAVSIVQDAQGNADKLAIYNHSDASILSNVPEGCVVAVKEPYYKYNGAKHDYMICVDHPSDVVLLRFNDPVIPDALRLGVDEVMLKSVIEWRSAGDRAFLERDLPTAVFCYTEALEAASPDDAALKAGIYSKRAGTNLVLGKYDAAKEDALASRRGDSTDWKAYFTTGRAAYGLCDYKSSRESFEAALELNASGPGLSREYERCLARLREETEGIFDFNHMIETVSVQNVHLDNATYVAPTYVADSPTHGRGVFASRNIKAGELIFCEKAILMPNQYQPNQASAALYAMVIRQLYDNPSIAPAVLRLHGGDYERSGAEGTIVDGVPVVDVFLLESIRLKNCFSSPLSTLEDTQPATETMRMAKGIWTYASYMNHSCVPNSMRSFIGDMLISRATRDISAGEEIFQHYVPIRAHPLLRQAQFREGWGFNCTCPLCSAEERSTSERIEKRRQMLQDIEKIANKKPPKTIVPDATIRSVEKLTKQLEEAHEPDIYEGLPRLMLIFPTMYLLETYKWRKNHAKVIATAMKLLRNFGFLVRDEDPRTIFENVDQPFLMTIHVVTALKFATESYRAMGQPELAVRCAEAATFGYSLITGFENDASKLELA